MGFFNWFKGGDAGISANPLVIVDSNDQIVFARAASIQVTTDENDAQVLSAATEGERSHKLVDAKPYLAPETLGVQLMMQYDRLQKGNRGGSVYEGLDEAGEPSLWYMDAAADALILARSRAVPPEAPAP